MGKNDEEDIFNALMSTPTGVEEKPKKISADIVLSGEEGPEELVSKLKERVVFSMSGILNLESYLQTALGPLFERIKGAWSQYAEGAIELDMLAHSGIYVLGRAFVDAFIEVKVQEQPQQAAKPALKEIVPILQNEETPIKKEVLPPAFKEEFKPVMKEEPKLAFKPEPKPSIKEEPAKTQPNIVIPTFFTDSFPEITPDPEIEEESEPEPKTPEIKVETLVSKAAPSIKPALQPFENSNSLPKIEPIAPQMPRKIESIAPEKKLRSTFEAMGAIDSQLEQVKLEPLKFDKIDDSELKTVNVGARTPGAPLADDFADVEGMLHEYKYAEAAKKLQQIKVIAENQNLDYQVDRAEEMLININIYKMLPSLIQKGDETIDQDLDKAEETYNKAMKIARMLHDSFYIAQIDGRNAQIAQRKVFVRQKQLVAQVEEGKIKTLIKENIVRLGKTETLSSISEIRKYCNAKSDEFVEDILVEMVQNKEIYAKYFPDSKKVIFDKDSNRELLIKGL